MSNIRWINGNWYRQGSVWEYRYVNSGRYRTRIYYHRHKGVDGDLHAIQAIRDGKIAKDCSFVERRGSTVLGGPYCVISQVLPHPASWSSRKRAVEQVPKGFKNKREYILDCIRYGWNTHGVNDHNVRSRPVWAVEQEVGTW